MRISSCTAAAFMLLLAQGVTVKAAEVKLLSASAMEAVVSELGSQFERTTGHKLTVRYDVAGILKRQIDAGETFDVVILTPPLIDDLVKQGKIATGTRTAIASSGMGVVVRAGAPKPDISSADAFKRALLNAKSIGYTKNTPSAAYLARLLDRLGIAEQMKPKSRLHEGTGATEQAVAAGDAELGFMTISSLLHFPGAELLGPLPPELQNYVVYTGAVGTSAQEPEAAKALINFLTSKSAVPVIKAKGMEPATQ